MAINNCVIAGNMTKNCEVIETKSGTKLCKFCIAVNDKRKKDDEYEEYTHFFNCVLFGEKRIKALKKFLKKGTRLTITGSLSYSSWEDDDDNFYSKIEILVDDIFFSSSKSKDDD